MYDYEDSNYHSNDLVEFLASKKLHTFIERNCTALQGVIPGSVVYDKHEQLYRYLAKDSFVQEIYRTRKEQNLKFDEAAYLTITLYLLNKR